MKSASKMPVKTIVGLLTVLSIMCAPLSAQEPDKNGGETPGAAPEMSPEDQAMMEAWMKAATPGPQHEQYKLVEGDWNVVATSYEGPEPVVTNGEAEFKTILGGRFLIQEYEGQMMGMPFEGFGIEGYDNVAQKYIGIWTDSMGTGFMHMEGASKDSGKTVEMFGTYVDPMKVTKKMRMVSTWTDDDHMSFDMFCVALTPEEEKKYGGKEMKLMNLSYTRDADDGEDDEDGEDDDEDGDSDDADEEEGTGGNAPPKKTEGGK